MLCWNSPRRSRFSRPFAMSLLAASGLIVATDVAGVTNSAAANPVSATGSSLVPPGSVASYVVSQPDGAPSVFVKRQGGSLWNFWYANGSWASSEITTGGMSSSPTAILQTNGSPSVFFQGSGGSLWNYWYANGSWASTEIASSGVGSVPAVGVQNNGAPTVFVQSTDGSLLNYFYIASTGAWGAGQVAPPGTALSAPSVIPQSGADGAPSVFVQGPGNALMNYWYIPAQGSWGAATVGGPGSAFSAPAVMAQVTGAPSVFVQGPGNALMNYWYIPAQGSWGAATVGGPGSAFSAPAVMGQQGLPSVPSVFVQGPGGSLLNFWYIPAQGTWGAGTVQNAGLDSTTPGLTSQSNGAPSVFFQGSDGSLWNYWYVNGTWDSGEPSLPVVTLPPGAPYLTYSANLDLGGSGTGWSATINIRDGNNDAVDFGVQTDYGTPSLHGQSWYIWTLVQNGNFIWQYMNPAPAGPDPVTIEWWQNPATAVVFEGSTPVASISGAHFVTPFYFGAEGNAQTTGDSVNDVITNTQINVPGGLGAWNTTQFSTCGLSAHDTNGQSQNGANFTITGTDNCPGTNGNNGALVSGLALIEQG